MPRKCTGRPQRAVCSFTMPQPRAAAQSGFRSMWISTWRLTALWRPTVWAWRHCVGRLLGKGRNAMRRNVNASLRLFAETTRGLCGPPISATSCGAYNSASFAATGRGWRHPTFTCKRPAPGRRARWPEIQEARCDRFGQSVSNGAEPETAERHMAARPWGSDPRVHPYGRPQLAAWLKKRRRRGCREATRWGGQPPLVGCRAAPAFPSHPRRRSRRGHWRLRYEKDKCRCTANGSALVR